MTIKQTSARNDLSKNFRLLKKKKELTFCLGLDSLLSWAWCAFLLPLSLHPRSVRQPTNQSVVITFIEASLFFFLFKELNVHLVCFMSEQVRPWEVKITDGCYGNCVVWVIILHRLGGTGHCVFQLIFSLRCEKETCLIFRFWRSKLEKGRVLSTHRELLSSPSASLYILYVAKKERKSAKINIHTFSPLSFLFHHIV